MEELQISSVYWIDDDNIDWKDLPADQLPDRIAEAWSEATEAQRKALTKSLEQGLSGAVLGKIRKLKRQETDDDDTFVERVSTSIRSMLGNDQSLIARFHDVGNQLSQPISNTDKSALCSLFAPTETVPWQWNRWSFNDWSKNGKQALGYQAGNKPCLFIIDLQNKDKAAGIDGRSILSALANSKMPREALHILVLTNECTKTAEFKLGRELTQSFFSSAAPIQLPVFAMAKERLETREDGSSTVADSIADGLSRICLSSQHKRLKELLGEVFAKAITEAFSSLEALTLEEFMYAVTHRSESEGVPEIDTLLRLISIEQRRQLQREVVANDEVQNVLMRIRGSGLAISKDELVTDSAIQALRVAELYDPGEVVNKLRSPVSPGDLFEVKPCGDSQSVIYCLVGNFCDASLRGEGKRKAEIGLMLPLEKLAVGGDGERLRYPLEKLNAIVPQGVAVDGILLNTFRSIDFAILDLCWTNDDGYCRWNSNLKSENRRRLSPSQTNRFGIIDEQFRTVTDKAALLSARVALGCDVRFKEQMLPNLRFGFVRRILTRIKPAPSTTMAFMAVDFGMRRIGRLTHAHASHLVAEFTDAIGRASRAHDFSSVHQS